MLQEKITREVEKRKRGTKDQCCRIIGVYFVGSQNSPTAASSSLGNFLNSLSDPPARDVFYQFIFSPRNNRAQVLQSRRIRHVLSFLPPPPLPPPPSAFFFSQFILRCLSARLDLSTYKWRSFVRLC